MNQDNPYAMNQTCKVCGEPAAGFHFGAFTCEGCKSFFGRSYNNITSIADCKNNGECIINKKNRTACKACRLRKCLVVGMSKSGSRYGRRSNWFKIHCLMQEQHQNAAAAMAAAAAAQQQHNASIHHHHHHHLTRHQHQQQSPVAHLHAAGHQQQQQQQQQAQAAAAAAAVHHQHQAFAAAAAAAHVQGLAAAAAAAAASGQKPAANPAGGQAAGGAATATPLTSSAAPPAARASDPSLSLLYHGRSKEELLMLGLDEYGGGGDKVARCSPSVGSPDSNHSDSSSVEVSVTRGSSTSNASGLTPRPRTDSGAGSPSVAASAAAGAAALALPQPLPLGRKELAASSAFLPLHFPGLGGMPVMPPPPFLPPPHLLLPGYHPSLYPHHPHPHPHPHHGLLKPSSEHQQQAVAAAAAVQHLFNRFTPAASVEEGLSAEGRPSKDDPSAAGAGAASNTPPSHAAAALMNGSKAAEELTKRFYLDALLKSQRYCGGVAPQPQPPQPPGSGSPPPAATKLPALPKYDHSISALVTPNSESGRERLRSRQSTEGYEDDLEPDCRDRRQSQEAKSEGVSDCDEDLVVSMTPPRSPPPPPLATPRHSVSDLLGGQDNPIDLSMKTTGSSSVSSAMSSAGSAEGGDDDAQPKDEEPAEDEEEEEEDASRACNNNNNNNNSCHENKNNDEAAYDTDEKMETLHRDARDFAAAPLPPATVDKPKVICCDSADKTDLDAFPQIEADDVGALPAVKRVKLQTPDDSLPPLDLSKI